MSSTDNQERLLSDYVMATVVVLRVLLVSATTPVYLCALPATLSCSHLACISSSIPLQIHLVSLQSSPDRTSIYRGSYSYLAPVYTLYSCRFSC